MNIIADGISVLYKYIDGIVIFFISVLGFGVLATKYIFAKKQTPAVEYIAACSVGSIVLSVVTYILVLFSHFLPFLLRPGSYAIVFFASFILLKEIYRSGFKAPGNLYVITGAGLFILLIIRLAFLKYILLPPYSDSPIHYQIVSGFIHPEASSSSKLSLGTLFSNYYHFGFHSLVAWLVSVAKINPSDAISLVGQLFLVIGPFSILFLVYTLTDNGPAAFFAAFVAAFAWTMPAFAVNWGKFPAITALAVLPSVMTLLGLYQYDRSINFTKILWAGILLIGITLMHTRIVICIMLMILCLWVSTRLSIPRTLTFFPSVRFALLFLISLWPLMPMLEEFYNKPLIVLGLILLLPFAFASYPRWALSVFLFIFGLWLTVKIPIVPVGNDRSLLDKQFLEIMLYIPFSWMGGMGFAGLMKRISFNPVLQWLFSGMLIASILFGAWRSSSMRPDSCCNYFTENDAAAFHWIDENVSDHAIFMISSFNDGGRILGTDAGIWIFPLLSQPTNRLPYNLDWDSVDGYQHICQIDAQKIYIYVGGKSYSFDSIQLSTKSWSTVVFQAGTTVIYQVASCSE